MNRKTVWLDNHQLHTDPIVFEVAEVLNSDDFNVELFGVSVYARHLPTDYQIVDYGSRETLAICENGEVTTDADKINMWLESQAV